jgi:hypothetical protein
MNRAAKLVVGLIVAVLGFFCLNFTNGFGIEHHTEWANAHQMPAPSPTIFYAGVVLLALGGGMIGYSIGRSRKT